jgi:hypothetical protein
MANVIEDLLAQTGGASTSKVTETATARAIEASSTRTIKSATTWTDEVSVAKGLE